jgi:hypothetical protein
MDKKKPKVKAPKGGVSMTGPQKLLAAGKKRSGAAKTTPSKRLNHKKQVY